MIPQAPEPIAHPARWPSPVSEHTPVTSLAAAASQDSTEAAIVQPVRAGRGARLSFLGGKKNPTKPNGDPPQTRSRGPSYSQPQTRTQRSATQSTANTDSGQSRTRSGSGNAPPGRRSLFRHETPQTNGADSGSDWVTESNPRGSFDIGDKDGDKGVGIHKMGSVRRRLSMLKIGKRGGSVRDRTVMGSLDEE